MTGWGSKTYNTYFKSLQIELGSATSYEPYHDGGTATSPQELFAVGNAADEFEAVNGVTTHKMASVDLGTLKWITRNANGTTLFQASISDGVAVTGSGGKGNAICAKYPVVANGAVAEASNDKTMAVGAYWDIGCNVYVQDSSYSDATTFKTAMSGVYLYYEKATPTTSQSTPAQISLQAGNNNAIQTDGGRTLSSLDLGYDGTSFDVPLTSGRTYITKINNTTEVVTDGTTQHVTGGVDMIVDLTMLYNGVSSLITPITTWNALVADTGMYGDYTAYNAGEVVSSDNTTIQVQGDNGYNGGTATAGLLKGIPGSVYDQLEAVTGKITTRIGSYTFTGNETWTPNADGTQYAYRTFAITNAAKISNASGVTPTYFMAGYKATTNSSDNATDMAFRLNSGSDTANAFRIRDTSCTTVDQLKAKLAGKTVYYRLATYTSSTTTAQPLTQSTGNLTVLQTAGTLPVSLDIRHAVSEWDEPIVRNCKYIFRDNGEDSLVTGSTTVTYKHVVGGQHKLINLTQWFGRNREPSIDNFYKLFPTWKDADIPYDRGTVLNYKGTGVRTIGFNAYNHATGTAVLLGGNQYQICGTFTSVSYVDQWGNAEEITPDADGLFTPLNNGTLTVEPACPCFSGEGRELLDWRCGSHGRCRWRRSGVADDGSEVGGGEPDGTEWGLY